MAMWVAFFFFRSFVVGRSGTRNPTAKYNNENEWKKSHKGLNFPRKRYLVSLSPAKRLVNAKDGEVNIPLK